MTKRGTYYNEIAPEKAAALRVLMRDGFIAPGEVDERSIVDVAADDVRGFVQCHWFGGIGIWSYALRLAGWPDDRPVWTGSCPCQPFSVAGKRLGRDDARHLAPAWLGLIAECGPVQVFGEQVGAAVGAGWLDDLQDNLELEGYALGSATFPACSIGAPHIRQRLYFGAVRLADADMRGRKQEPHERPARLCGADGEPGERRKQFGDFCTAPVRLDDTASPRRDGPICGAESDPRDEARLRLSGAGCGPDWLEHAYGRDASAEREQRGGQHGLLAQGGGPVRLADANDTRPQGWRGMRERADQRPVGPRSVDGGERPGPTNGFWRDADWLHGRDGRWRPVEPGTFPLAHGTAARVGRLRAYGDGIVAPQAAAFIADFEAACGEVLPS